MTSWFHWLHIKSMLWLKFYFLSHGSCHQSRFIHFFILFPRTYVVLLHVRKRRDFLASSLPGLPSSPTPGAQVRKPRALTIAHIMVLFTYPMWWWWFNRKWTAKPTNKEDLKSKFWSPFSTSMIFSGLWNFNDCHRNATQYVIVVYC